MGWFSRRFGKAHRRDQLVEKLAMKIPNEIVNAIIHDNPKIEPQIGKDFYEKVIANPLNLSPFTLLDVLESSSPQFDDRKKLIKYDRIVQSWMELIGQTIIQLSKIICSVESPIVNKAILEARAAIPELEDLMDEFQGSLNTMCLLHIRNCERCVSGAFTENKFRNMLKSSLYRNVTYAENLLRDKGKSDEASIAWDILLNLRSELS